jgi:membrane-anchored mycosin MYCP
MAGPWVGVAAPAINVVSLDPTQPQPGALTNAAIVEGTPIPINGTSFSAAYVAGLAALIREKYPTLTSRQVINRILKTAHTPADGLSNVLGNGIIDPVAALTSPIEAGDIVAPGVPSEKAPVPVPPPAPDHTGRNIALAVLGGAGLFVGAIALAAFAFRSPRS